MPRSEELGICALIQVHITLSAIASFFFLMNEKWTVVCECVLPAQHFLQPHLWWCPTVPLGANCARCGMRPLAHVAHTHTCILLDNVCNALSDRPSSREVHLLCIFRLFFSRCSCALSPADAHLCHSLVFFFSLSVQRLFRFFSTHLKIYYAFAPRAAAEVSMRHSNIPLLCLFLDQHLMSLCSNHEHSYSHFCVGAQKARSKNLI